jgi:Domain of unknown function (DUF4124)
MNARDVSRWALVLALALGIGFVAAEGRAQAYKYKDERGHVHFTENYYEVPEKFRSQIETREMPKVVDPNAPAAEEPAPGTAAASFEDGLRHGMGRDLTVKQQDALHAWIKRWTLPGIAALALNVAIALAMVVHAFVQGHIGWGLANFFLGVSSPFYIMVKLEQSVVVRLGLLLLYLAPFIVMGMAVSELTGMLG